VVGIDTVVSDLIPLLHNNSGASACQDGLTDAERRKVNEILIEILGIISWISVFKEEAQLLRLRAGQTLTRQSRKLPPKYSCFLVTSSSHRWEQYLCLPE
jgi:hypothetical protein